MRRVSRRSLLQGVGAVGVASFGMPDSPVFADSIVRPQTAGLTGVTVLNLPRGSFSSDGFAYPPIPVGSTYIAADIYIGATAGVTVTVSVDLRFKVINSNLEPPLHPTVSVQTGLGIGPFPFPSVGQVVLQPLEYVEFHVALGLGYFQGATISYVPPSAASGGAFVSGPVSRVVDTRVGLGGPALQPGEERLVTLPIALSGTHASVFNVTVTNTMGAGGGFLSVFPADTTYKTTSSLNWSMPGSTVAALVISGTDSSNRVRVRCGGNATDVIVDYVGSI